MDLGRLQKVSLREIWEHEAMDFTTWLAKEENLELLSEELGIDGISLKQTEAKVGDFKVDILAEEENTGRVIIIENQLELTNHDHLGKIITYASGHDAEIIIWIVKDVKNEHKQAVDWLNEHTDEKINFFAIKMELWKIRDSPPAPKFQIISKPNTWTKAIRKSSQQDNLTETKLLQLEFWEKFREYAQNKGSSLRFRSPRPQHWYNFSIGTSEAHMVFTVNSKEKLMTCNIYIPHNKTLFDKLKEDQNEIGEKLGANLEWMELPDKQASRIRLTTFSDFTLTDNWAQYFEWMIIWGEKFQQVFGDYVRKANIEINP